MEWNLTHQSDQNDITCAAFIDVMAELSVTSPEVTEGGVVEVCVDIVAGTVGTAGHIVTVSNDETRGSATGEFSYFSKKLAGHMEGCLHALHGCVT